MKNIYNLITDAFVRIGEDETKYSITVEYTEFTLRSYGITIRPRYAHAQGGTARIVLLLNSDLIDYYETNDLFVPLEWERFCDVFEWQI